MMDWQLLAAALCIAWAIYVVVRRALGLRRSPESASCGSGCGSCSSNAMQGSPSTKSDDEAFVSLDSLHSLER